MKLDNKKKADLIKKANTLLDKIEACFQQWFKQQEQQQ